MAFENVELPADENLDYWNPSVKGECIEGNLCGTETSKYNPEMERMILETKNGHQITLPAGAILNRFLKTLKIGDYIKVTYDGEKPSNNPAHNPTKLYHIEKDAEQFAHYD